MPDFPAKEVRESVLRRLRALQWDSGDAVPTEDEARLGDVVEGIVVSPDGEKGVVLDQVEIPMDPVVAEAKGIDLKLVEAALGRRAGEVVALGGEGGSSLPRLHIGRVSHVTLARLDDEFAKDHGYETLDELLDAVVAEVLPKVAEAARKRIHAQILSAFADQLEVEVHDKAREELEAQVPRTTEFPQELLVELVLAQHQDEAVRRYLLDRLEGAEVPAARATEDSDEDAEEARYAEAWRRWVDEHYGVPQAIEARMAEWREAARAVAREVVQALEFKMEELVEESGEESGADSSVGVSSDDAVDSQPVAGGAAVVGEGRPRRAGDESSSEHEAESPSPHEQDETPHGGQPEEGSPRVVVESEPAAMPAAAHEEPNR